MSIRSVHSARIVLIHAFGVRVLFRALRCRLFDLDAFGTEHGIERFTFGISSDTEDDTAYLALEDEDNVDATETHQIDVKKVASQHGLGVCRQESAPGSRHCAWARMPVGGVGLADRRGRDAVPPASQLAVDPRVSPCGCRRPEARSTPRDSSPIGRRPGALGPRHPWAARRLCQRSTVPAVTRRSALNGVGSSLISVANIDRSAQSSRGFGFIHRRTAT